MANKYFDKMNHISRDSHVKLSPASHENPVHSIALFKVRTTVIPSTCLFVLWSSISPFGETHANALKIGQFV